MKLLGKTPFYGKPIGVEFPLQYIYRNFRLI